MQKKLDILKNIIYNYESVAVAFSGGVDSSFLAKVAYDVLGENALAVTANVISFPLSELLYASNIASQIGIRHTQIEIDQLNNKEFMNNDIDRCYYCKKNILGQIKNFADSQNIKYIVEGSNVDDDNDYRPGMRAVKEMGVQSPLKQAGLTKNEVRQLSKQMGLLSWDKPSLACLVSRIPYGDEITKEKLRAIDKAEQKLYSLGFKQFRVRHHGDIARIELLPDEVSKLFLNNINNEVYEYFNSLGFKYTALDIKGYRLGSLNEGLI